MKNVALHNLGCKVNSYELELMTKKLLERGYGIVPFDSTADAYIINTCTVTQYADHKTRQMLRKARSLNPDALIIAAGCYVEIERPEDSAPGRDRSEDNREPLYDIAVSNKDKDRIADILDSAFGLPPDETCAVTSDISQTSLHTRAFLKIQDGCNQFCTYCIIPYARGRIKSRPLSDIVCEARSFASAGRREIVLTGIHISSYGTDTDDADLRLITVAEALQDIEGLERIRLGSIEPRMITEDFVKRASKIKNLCPHFHLSLQSGCNETLHRMNRHYTVEDFERSVDILRTYYDRPAVTTDVIAGFPGETDDEFRQTYDFLEKISLYELHVFPYSVRKGTVAASMPDQIDRHTKQERAAALSSLTQKQSDSYRSSFAGQRVDVLWECFDDDGENILSGYTDRYIRVSTDRESAASSGAAPGLITSVIYDP